MAKAELGLKRTCVNCNARFYDLNRMPPVCPKCGAAQPTNLSRLKQRNEELPDDKDKDLSQDDHETDVDLDTADDADDVMVDDDISHDIEVTTGQNERDDT